MDSIEALKSRRSIRSFQKRVIPKDVLEEIVDCGRLAASARNIQPWKFVVVTEKKVLEKLGSICDYGSFIANASACIVVVCEDTKYFLEDGSAATQNILVAAHSKGLGGCWVAGDKKTYAGEVLELLNAPSSIKLISLIPLGYIIKKAGSPPKKGLEEVFIWERF
ncbi:MAG: nitroreductase family protein [Candidatus Altiarchaeota archaeon]